MADKEYDYSSSQINMNEEWTSIFLDRGRELISKKDLSGTGLETNPHVTVLYGIHDLDPSPKIVDIIETYPRFNITLGAVSLFKEDAFNVVKVDVESSDLYSLRGAFMNNCYFTDKHPEYIPHMTVGFVKPESCNHLDGSLAFKGMSFVAEEVVYSCKDGVKRFLTLGLR